MRLTETFTIYDIVFKKVVHSKWERTTRMLVLTETSEMPRSVYMALFKARGSFGSSESFFFGCLRLHISSSG